MKVAVFLRDLNSGGAEKIMVKFINYLCEHTSDEVYLILSRKKGPYLSLVNPKAKIIILHKERSIYSILPLYLYLKNNKVDVLYSTLLNANLTSILIGKLLNIKVIIREANTISEFKKVNNKLKDSLTIYFIKHIYNLCYKCISISNIVKIDLLSHTNLEEKKINVIYNPIIVVDNENHLFLDEEYFHIGLVSRLSTQKNIPTVIKVIEHFIKKDKKVKFHFFGEGEQGELLKEINSKYESSIIELHGFQISYYSCIKKMDLFMHIPLWEGLGNSVLEVYNSGIPMILSDIKSGYSELITKGQSNVHYFHPTDQIEEIIFTIEKYLNKEIINKNNRITLKLDASDVFRKYRSLA